MRGQVSSPLRLALAILLGPLPLLSWLANTASGKEIQLPSLRVQVSGRAPDFALPAAGGKTIRLSDFSGRNVLIDFYWGYR
jgi:hypothetical protein